MALEQLESHCSRVFITGLFFRNTQDTANLKRLVPKRRQPDERKLIKYGEKKLKFTAKLVTHRAADAPRRFRINYYLANDTARLLLLLLLLTFQLLARSLALLFDPRVLETRSISFFFTHRFLALLSR